jgi:acetylornithine/succinyldiaminopimelate/putrescine aminotransferase
LNTDFLKYQAQTSLSVGYGDFSCKRFYIYATNNKKYLDFVAGFLHVRWATSLRDKPGYQRSVGQVFACYGMENILKAQLWNIASLASLLPESLDKTYLVNSGTEAIEGR